MLNLVLADRVPKEAEGEGSKLNKHLRRKGWMQCAVGPAVPEGRMSPLDFVEVAAVVAAEVLVFGLAVVDFAFPPSRRLF